VLEEDLTMDDMSMEAGDYEQERMRFKPTDLSEYLSFMNAIKEVLNKPEYSAHFEYHPVGNPAATEYDMKMLEEMGSLYMGMIMIIIVMLWFLCRSVSGVLWPLTIVILSCIWTVGLTGWLGFTVTGHLVLTVVMVLVVGIADAIHIISGYIFFRKEGHDHQSALRQSYGKSGKAILLTTVTTMIAMLVLTITPIAPIKVFGFMTAAGIGLAFIFSIYLLPLLLDLWSVMKKDPSKSNVLSRLLKTLGKVVPDFAALTQRGLVKVLPIVERRKTAIVYGSFAVFALCMYGATQVKVDTDPIAQYPQDSKIRTSFEIADTKMVGTQVMEIYLDMGEEYAFHDPKVLKAIEQLQIKLETDYSQWVVRTSSLVGVVKDSYQTLNENRKEMYIIPDDPRVLSQTLFMFNNSNPVDRRKMVSDDYRRSHISVYLYNGGSYEYTQVFEQMRADIELTLKSLEATYPDSKVSITGMFTLLMQGSDYLSWSSLTSFGLVVVIITVILLLVFGSFKAGLISVVPNLVPATLTFGVMGLLDIPMDFTTVMIAPIIIGIAVDDTIHFLNHYRSEVLIDGDIRRALSQTIHEVGQAVMFTSLILGLGLSVLSVSSSVGNANVGMFGSAAVFTALLCDLFLLPALILMFKLDFAGSKQAVQKPQATAQVSS
jgi:predicted RND superfamily exporter protein